MSLAAEIAKLEADRDEQRAHGLRLRTGLVDIVGICTRLGIEMGPPSERTGGIRPPSSVVVSVDGLDAAQWHAKYETCARESADVAADLMAKCDDLNHQVTQAHGALTVACDRYEEVVGELRAEVARLKTMPLGSTRASALAYVTGLAEKYQDECANDNALEDAEFGRQVIKWLNGIRDSDPTIFEPIPGTENLHEGRDARAWATDYHEAIGLLRSVIQQTGRIVVEPADLGMWTLETQDACKRIDGDGAALASYVSGVADLMKRLGTSSDGDPEDKCVTCVDAIGDLQRRAEAAEYAVSSEAILEAIDRAVDWTVQGVRDELAIDPLWLAKRLGPNERLRKGLDAYTAGQKADAAPQAETPIPDFPGDEDDDSPPIPPKDGPPEAAYRFARNIIGMPEAEIAKVWSDTWSVMDREAAFRDVCSRYSGETVPPEVAPAAPAKRTKEDETTIPDGWTPDKAQVQHGKTLGFTADQVQNLAASFAAEARANGWVAARWGSRFRSYLTEIAATRSAR